MALNEVTPNLGGVTGCEVRRYSQPFPDDFKVRYFLDGDGKTSSLHMLNPTFTTPAIRILVHENAWTLGEGGRQRHSHRNNDQSHGASACQAARMNE
jgi:hypothetical protein